MSCKINYKQAKNGLNILNIKNSTSYEKLKTIVNALNSTLESSIVQFNTNVELSKEKVKFVLEELIGGKDGIIHVVLDETGNLFSSNLLEEANSGLNCLKKIKNVMKIDEGKLKKPIILVTGKMQAIRIVLILPNEFQSADSSCNYPLVYSIDPLNGKRDLLNQTSNKILDMYLRKGSAENQISPLFSSGIKTSEYKADVRKCSIEADSGWWCIYYCFYLIHNGNDHFLEDSSWSTINVEFIKTVLLSHVDLLGIDEQNTEKKVKKEANFSFIKNLNKINDEINQFFNAKERKIQENLDSIKNSSVEEKIKMIFNDEETLKKAKEKLKKEIKELDDIIKQGEVFLLSKSTIETTDSRFKRIVTGEEKAALEAKALKKEEKSKESILVHNEKERKAIIEEEIKKLEDNLKGEEKKLIEKFDKKNEVLLSIKNSNEQIQTNEKNIENYKTQNDLANSNLVNFENEKTRLDKLKSEINRILVDSEYTNLIDKLLKSNTGCDTSSINSIKTSLEACDKAISDYNGHLKSYDDQIKSNNDKIAEKRILITSCNSSISDLNTKLEETNSKVKHYEQKVEEYSGFFTSWWWKEDYESFSQSLNEWKSKRSQQNNEIANYKSQISAHQSSINQFESSNGTQRTDKSKCEQNLETERKNRTAQIENLKKQRNSVIDALNESVKNLDSKIKECAQSIETNEINKKSANDSIKRLKNEIERQNQELGNIELSIKLNENSKMNILDKINKTKEKLRINEVEVPKVKAQVVPGKVSSKNVTSQNKFVDSIILNDQAYIELMNLCQFKDQKWKLIYRATRDGFKGEDFHKICDGFPNTLTLIRTVNSSVFGGFASTTWSETDGFKEDSYAFLFSLENKTNQKLVIKCSEPSNAIYCNQNYGPCFGNDDIKISSMSDSNSESESVLGYVYGENVFEYGSDESKTFLAGSKYFQTDEIEVFAKDSPFLAELELKEMEISTKKDINTIKEAYDIFNAIAINGKIYIESFTNYLMNKVKVFKNQKEIDEMKELFEFIFKYFDEDKSGELEFKEFITSYSIFDSQNKKDVPILFFGFFFDYADKDKSQTLDIEEIEDLISKFPSVFKKNKEIVSIKNKLKKSSDKNHLSKEEFLNLFQDSKFHKQISIEEVMAKSKFIDSNILATDKLYFDFVNLCNLQDQKWKLIYRATRDGFRASDFHDKCDNKPNTLTLIKTADSSIFGGFANATWSRSDEFKNDPSAFIFTLVNNPNKALLIECKKKENAIYCNEENGPCFGNGDIIVVHGSNLNERSSLSIGDSYFHPDWHINELDNNKNFRSVEIEVFCKEQIPLSSEQITVLKKKYRKTESMILEAYNGFNGIAINSRIKTNKLLDFMLQFTSDEEEKYDFKRFFTMITDHFDTGKTGILDFNQFMECCSVLELSELNKQQFFELLFDMADQDKNQVLDLNEIKELFNNLPENFKKSESLNYVIKKLESKQIKNFNKDEFIEILEDIENS